MLYLDTQEIINRLKDIEETAESLFSNQQEEMICTLAEMIGDKVGRLVKDIETAVTNKKSHIRKVDHSCGGFTPTSDN